jgi:hypothetical protein
MKEDLMEEKMKLSEENARSSALRFVVLLGFVSLFSDMTYEAARSISGPYLGLLEIGRAHV